MDHDPLKLEALAVAQKALNTHIEVQTKNFARALMGVLAGKLSEKFDAFSTWLLAGFGAALALLLSSHETPLSTVPHYALRRAAILFCIAAIVMVFEKYLAIIVQAGAEAATGASDLLDKHFERMREKRASEELDFPLFRREFVRPLFWPVRALIGISLSKAQTGDLAAGARPLVRISQLQGAAMFALVVIFLIAVLQIALAIPK